MTNFFQIVCLIPYRVLLLRRRIPQKIADGAVEYVYYSDSSDQPEINSKLVTIVTSLVCTKWPLT